MKPLGILSILLFLCIGLPAQKMIKEVEKKFDNGKPEVISYYRNEVSTRNLAKREIYSADGKKSREENYQDGKLHGKVSAWKAFDGTPEYELNYVMGKLEGAQKYFFTDGRVKMELNYANGRMEGRQVEYWFKGSGDTLKAEHNYSGGILHGMQRQWHKDFRPKYNYNFVAGKPDGIQRTWTETQELTEERWKSGVYEEVLKTWTAAQPKQVKVYDYAPMGDSLNVVLGKVLQKEVHYHETGSISAITTGGDLPETQEFHLGGKVKGKGKGTVDKREGKWEFWHPNGQRMMAGEYLGGRKVGLHETWDEKGSLIEEEVWSLDGNRRESWRVFFYHPNGKKQSEGALDDQGRRKDTWKYWYADGSKQREETWAMSCAKGGGRPFVTDFSEWDESGKLIRKGTEAQTQEWKYFPAGSPIEIVHRQYPFRDPCTPEPVEKYKDRAMVKSGAAAANYDNAVILQKITFYESGDTARIDRFNAAGKREGLQEGWFANGKKQFSYHYLDGRVQGTVKEWYADGQIMLDYKVQSAVGGPARLVEGTAYTDKGKDYAYKDTEGKEQKKQMQEIEAISYYKRFLEENK